MDKLRGEHFDMKSFNPPPLVTISSKIFGLDKILTPPTLLDKCLKFCCFFIEPFPYVQIMSIVRMYCTNPPSKKIYSKAKVKYTEGT